MRISFTCEVCSTSAPEPARVPNWARLAAHDGVEWSESLYPEEGEFWHRMEAEPEVGRWYGLRVRHPFEASDSAPFWVLFQPALSALNGWEEHPSELAASGVALCKLLSVLSEGPNRGWIGVEVLDFVAFAHAASRFEARDGELPFFYDAPGTRTDWGDLSLLETSHQSDVGSWGLFQLRSDGPVLVAACDWGFHGGWVYVGHRAIGPREWTQLERRAPTRR